MDNKTKKALEASIKHWEENAAAETPDDVKITHLDCALCGLFFVGDCDEGNGCEGCPVYEFTGVEGCKDTPYQNAYRARNAWSSAHTGHVLSQTEAAEKAFRAAARVEIRFLKGLRDEQ